MLEFTDVCYYYLGRWGQYASIVFSMFALLGAAVVYWVLMSNFLFHTVNFIYGMYIALYTTFNVNLNKIYLYLKKQ